MLKNIHEQRKNFLDNQYYHSYGSRKFDPKRDEEYYISFIYSTYIFNIMRGIHILDVVTLDENDALDVLDLEGYHQALKIINDGNMFNVRKILFEANNYTFDDLDRNKIFQKFNNRFV